MLPWLCRWLCKKSRPCHKNRQHRQRSKKNLFWPNIFWFLKKIANSADLTHLASKADLIRDENTPDYKRRSVSSSWNCNLLPKICFTRRLFIVKRCLSFRRIKKNRKHISLALKSGLCCLFRTIVQWFRTFFSFSVDSNSFCFHFKMIFLSALIQIPYFHKCFSFQFNFDYQTKSFSLHLPSMCAGKVLLCLHFVIVWKRDRKLCIAMKMNRVANVYSMKPISAPIHYSFLHWNSKYRLLFQVLLHAVCDEVKRESYKGIESYKLNVTRTHRDRLCALFLKIRLVAPRSVALMSMCICL